MTMPNLIPETDTGTDANGMRFGLIARMAGRMLLHGANGFARFVTWVSLIGLVLGVGILTLVVNVMNGFDHELRQRLLGSIPHVSIAQTPLSSPLQAALASDPRVKTLGKYYQGFGVVAAGARTQPVSVIGFAGEELATMDAIASVMQRGELANLQGTANAVVMGEPLARYQGLSLGDPVMIGVTVGRGDSVTLRWLRLNLVGTFEMGAETDYSMVLLNLDGHTDTYWGELGQVGTRVMLNNPMQAGVFGRRLRELEPAVSVDTWEDVYGELFQAVRMEKTMMFVLLLLVVAIAGFNIIAGQSMMVHDKRAQIAMLRTLGADRRFVLSLFLSQGAVVAIFGTAAGLGLGMLLTVFVNDFVDVLGAISGQHLLDGSYFVSVPTQIVTSDVLIIAVLSSGIALLSAWLPARRASQLNPAHFLH